AGPIDVLIRSKTGDQLLRLDLRQAVQYFEIDAPQMVTAIELDPFNWILNSVGINEEVVSFDPSENPEIIVFPNPATDFWTIKGVDKNSRYQVFDLSGKLLAEDRNSTVTFQIDSKKLTPGMYVLK